VIARADESEKGVSPMLLNNLARTLAALHRFTEAADYADRAYTTAQRLGEKIVVNHSLRIRAIIYTAQGELDRAAAVISELESMLQETPPAAPISLTLVAALRSTLALARADHETALAEANRVISTIEASGRYLDILATQFLGRADIHLKTRHFEAARADAQRALALEQQLVEPAGVSSRIGRAYLALARALHAQEKHDEARTAFVSAREHLQPTLGADHPDTREAAQRTGTPR
jgi:tetratricopeptide (TPR) repeat protein